MYLIQVRHTVRSCSGRRHKYERKTTSAPPRISFHQTLKITGYVLTFLLHVLEGNHEIRQKARHSVALCCLRLLLRLLLLLLQHGGRTLRI